MTQGILSRYLSGTGTDPLGQQGGMEGYLSQYNVNPYWQQFLQNGNQGLLAGSEQPTTQGNQNPYYQGDNIYGAGQEQQQPAAPAPTSTPYQLKEGENTVGIEINPFSMYSPQERQFMNNYWTGDTGPAARQAPGAAYKYQIPADIFNKVANSGSASLEKSLLEALGYKGA